MSPEASWKSRGMICVLVGRGNWKLRSMYGIISAGYGVGLKYLRNSSQAFYKLMVDKRGPMLLKSIPTTNI